MTHETIINGAEITVNGEKMKVKIDHMLDMKDEDEQYTGCYRATINTYTVVNVELNNDAIWIETGKGPSELAAVLGNLIESNAE